MGLLHDRVIAFCLKSRLNLSIINLCNFLKDEYKGIDCNDIKKNYASISPNDINIQTALSQYIISVIKSSDKINEIPDDVDLLEMVMYNLDIFFEITKNNDDSYFVEIGECE